MDGDDRELHGTMNPNPFDELADVDESVKMAALDEHKTMFDPNTHPKLPHPKEEGVTDVDGERNVDVMADTMAIDDVLGVNLSDGGLLDL